jgi:hypothetical protein
MCDGSRKRGLLRCQVLTAANMKMSVFWVVAPCSVVGVNRRFRGSCCLYHADMYMCIYICVYV